MSISLRITNPCHEDWNTMSGDDKKRLCAVCDKYVHNFAQSGAEEALQTYLLNIHNGTCGHMPKSGLHLRQNQVLNVVTSLVHQNSGKNLAFAILTIGTLLAANAKAQTNPHTADTITPFSNEIEVLDGEVMVAGGIEAAPVPETSIFTIVEVMPEFPGGETALFDYIKAHLEYPKRYKAGVVYVSFVVNATGEIKDARVIRGIETHPEMDEAALHVVEKMPNWKPGEQVGKKVNVQYNLPIRFTEK